jgi:glycerophosphoryl diester phosphodiesterase
MEKVAVFDFDCTITQVHAYFLLNHTTRFKQMYNNIDASVEFYNNIQNIDIKELKETNRQKLINIVFGSEERIQFLKNIFDNFKKAGYFIVIASDGKYNNINDLLKLVNLRDYFDIIKDGVNVYSNNKYLIELFTERMQKYNYDKTYFINEIFNAGIQQIVYFDDDPIYFHKFKNMKYSNKLGFYKCIDQKDRILYFCTMLKKHGTGLNSALDEHTMSTIY